MNLYLYRKEKTITFTHGRLYFLDMKCDSLEDPVREILDLNGDGDFDDPGEGKIYGDTAIPAGTYEIKMKYSPHFKRMMPYLQDVKGFTSIMIHPGNETSHTRGCLLVGEYVKPGKLINSRQWSDLINEKLIKAELSGEKNYIVISND